VRVNFNYFISEATFEYIIEAVKLIASHGWKLLPLYRFDPATSLWRHRQRQAEQVMRLQELSYRTGKLQYRSRHATEPEWALQGYLEDARAIFDAAAPVEAAEAESWARQSSEDGPERLRWFSLPAEASEELGACCPLPGGQAR
jgi:hypothetical protein